MNEIATMRDTLSRAVQTLDRCDDIETLSEIGAPADILYDCLRELTRTEATLAIDRDLFVSARDVLRSTPDRRRRMSWLTGRGGLAFEDAAVLADLSFHDIEQLMADRHTLVGIRLLLISDATEACERLGVLLDEHEEENGTFTAPDTVPAGW